MPISFDAALGIHPTALQLRAKRAGVLANNLANADTPQYKARDIDFRSALNSRMQGSTQNTTGSLQLAVTNKDHNRAFPSIVSDDKELLYRTPQQPTIDGNTVEEHVEHGEYMKNTLAFQASFTFLDGSFKGLKTALRGE